MGSERRAGDARRAALAVGQDVEADGDQLPEQLRAPAPAVEDHRHAAIADQVANFVEHNGQHLDQPRVGLGGDHEQGLALGVVDPVVGGGGHGQAYPGDMGLRQAALAVIGPYVPIDVEQAHGMSTARDPPLGEDSAEVGRVVEGRESRQLAA